MNPFSAAIPIGAPSAANFERSFLSENNSVSLMFFLRKDLSIRFPTSLRLLKTMKERARIEQFKIACLRSNTSPQRGSRGSRDDGGIDEGAVSGASVQTSFGGQNDGGLGGASGNDGGMARGEATTLRCRFPSLGSVTPQSVARVLTSGRPPTNTTPRPGGVGFSGWLVF